MRNDNIIGYYEGKTFMTLQKDFINLALITLCSCGDNSINTTQTTRNNNIGSDTSALSLLPTIIATIDINEEFTNDNIDIDSLLSILDALPPFGTTAEGDTSRINTLNILSFGYEITGTYDNALHYANEAYTLSSNNSDRLSKLARDEMLKGKANALYNIGIIHYDQGNYSLAMDFYLKSLAIREQHGDKKGIADSYNRIGNVHKDKGNYPLAMDYYQKSLTIREQLGDKNGIAYCYNDIGNVHADQGNTLALEYYLKSFRIRKEIGDKRGIADFYNNVGIYYIKEGVYPLALKFYMKSLTIREVLGDKKGIADSYHNMANVHMAQGNYPLAIEYNMKSLKIREELDDKKGMSSLFNNIGIVYQRQSNYSLALEYYSKSFKIKEELDDKLGMSYLFNCIGWLALEEGDYAKAIENSQRGLALAKEIGALPVEKFSHQIIEKALKEHSNNVYGVCFQEFSVFITEMPFDSFPIEYYPNIQEVQDDTAWLSFEVGGKYYAIQKIIINTDQLINLTIEQCFQRTIALTAEGPHVELNDLIQQNSYWEKIKLNDDGQIVNSNENEIVWEKFSDVNINELKLKVKEYCGDYWSYPMSGIKTLDELQNILSINRHLLRVSGKRKDNGQNVTKIIIIELPMGC